MSKGGGCDSNGNKQYSFSNIMKIVFNNNPEKEEVYKLLVKHIEKDKRAGAFRFYKEGVTNILKSLNKNNSDIEEIKSLSIKQEYSKSDFIRSVNRHITGLPETEIQKIYDYFGFELKKTGNSYEIIGYPVNSSEEYSYIKNPKTKSTIEKLSPVIVKYTQNNQILCNNPEIGELLNNILNAFPELRVNIDGKNQVLEHILIQISNITKSPEYEKLNKQDKKLILLSAFFGNINKMPAESACDANYILLKITQKKMICRFLFSVIK